MLGKNYNFFDVNYSWFIRYWFVLTFTISNSLVIQSHWGYWWYSYSPRKRFSKYFIYDSFLIYSWFSHSFPFVILILLKMLVTSDSFVMPSWFTQHKIYAWFIRDLFMILIISRRLSWINFRTRSDVHLERISQKAQII